VAGLGKAWKGSMESSICAAHQSWQGLARSGMAWRGEAGLGKAWKGSMESSICAAHRSRRGLARSGMAGHGQAGQGGAWKGIGGATPPVLTNLGQAGLGLARLGSARHGQARRGEEGQCKGPQGQKTKPRGPRELPGFLTSGISYGLASDVPSVVTRFLGQTNGPYSLVGDSRGYGSRGD